MAITHFTAQIISRGEGRSAVLSAAYRHCARMEHEGEGRVVDYSNKRGLIHEEFLLPPDAPVWIRALIADRSVSGAVEAFWNKVEQFEKRADAQFAREFIIALPIELSAEQNVALLRDFVADQILARGKVADWVYHDEPGNPHVHLMTTLRPLTDEGFGPKKVAVTGEDGQPLRNPAGKIVYKLWSGEKSELILQRQTWYECQNRHLALAGFDIRVDGRSYAERGIDIVPTIHIGVAAKAIEREAKREGRDPELDRLRIHEEARAENARRIVDRPDIVLHLISREMSVFCERDIAKILHRYIDDAGTFQQLMARILQRPQVIRLEAERVDFATGSRLPSKYTTRELIRLEAEMARRSAWLSERNTFEVKRPVLDRVFSRQSKLSDEQKSAIEHVAANGQIAAIVGRAGAGKTTMMKAAREAWEAAGYRVFGGALAGKAAEGLEREAAIVSRTLSSWELRWQKGNDQLDDRTVFVLDEAGMVSSRQMALFVETATRTGAKIVLVGDPEQLQPIEAGAAFRAIADRIGYAELETIYRQRQPWMRDASLDLARGRVAEAIAVYRQNGRVFGSGLKSQAVSSLIDDWNRDYDPTKTTLILAHLRRDVRMLNAMARARLVERGIVDAGHLFRTEDGDRRFAAGDQIVFLKNEGSLGVKNGMLAKIVEAGPTRFAAQVGEGEHRRLVDVDQRFYRHVDHGYATTVHKSQGATVDRVKVLASLSLDRHLTYVALTRHREDVALYYGRRSFDKAGGLIPILSQRRAKETTLDYENGRFYRTALAYAESRGLHIARVARTLLSDRLNWTVRQKQKLVDLGNRLFAIGRRLGALDRPSDNTSQVSRKARPMVAGITTFPRSVSDMVEDKLVADPGLNKIWEDVSTRFRLVFADPEAAFKAVNMDAVLVDPAVRKSILAILVEKPETFGALRGKSGLLSSKADRQARDQAEINVPALKRDIERYLRARSEAEYKHEAEERAIRLRVATDIPALSPAASAVLERVRDAIDRNDLPAALGFALSNREAKMEIDTFGKAVSHRFGERTLLGFAAKDTNGQTFREVTTGMNPAQTAAVNVAWPMMRAAQKLAAHERSTEAQKQSETMRLSQRPGLGLK
ncbi:Ti-type conjugative transfer relaxase TraA [Rhizobium sp. Leaf386]|uniref:Ti-type conjugative transfer relaxase TraA n=1 Tax=Rhizobium sp. Leaf386 TaxID=1736359 RepID=UPI000713407C|nr:Ti-type conjugative transfer relaxase TraA [Rhizobium sp. Leaf386]KQS95604.1 Dtr system oriT relaxase [Rhizobium sp. Leaf386]